MPKGQRQGARNEAPPKATAPKSCIDRNRDLRLPNRQKGMSALARMVLHGRALK
jgi:hypothetical protein